VIPASSLLFGLRTYFRTRSWLLPPFFFFFCAVRYSDSPDFYHHQKLYQRNCVHRKNSGYPLSRHAYKWLLYKVQLCAFGGFSSHRLKAVNRTLYTALTPMHTSSRVQFQWIPCRIQARSPSSAPSVANNWKNWIQLFHLRLWRSQHPAPDASSVPGPAPECIEPDSDFKAPPTRPERNILWRFSPPCGSLLSVVKRGRVLFLQSCRQHRDEH